MKTEINRVVHILRMTGDEKDKSTLFKAFGFQSRTDIEIDKDGAIKFATPHCTPYDTIEEASRLHPNVKISVIFADEDLGNNVGAYILKGGERLKEFVPENGSIEAYKMAMDILENYHYIDEFMFDFNEDDAGEELPELLMKLAYDRGVLYDEYPEFVLNRFLEWAIQDENFEMASKLRDNELITLN